jgi:ER lumen protein retaining receptor
VFTYLGDLLHLASFLLLLLKIYTTHSVKGISLNSQVSYLIVFAFRYLDLFHTRILYLFVMKVVYLFASALIVYLIAFKLPYKRSYNASQDSLNCVYLVVPSVLLGLLFHEDDQSLVFRVLWSASYFLESVSILPQLVVVHDMARHQSGFVENLTSHYVFSLGGYRVLYLLNWIYRYVTEESYWHPIVWITGTVQTLFYLDFFYYYAQSLLDPRQKAMRLPI